MKNYIYITVAIITFTFAAVDTTYACSCMMPTGSFKTQVSNAYKGSTAIFTGKVTSVEKTADGDEFSVKVAVKNSWKGTASAEITIRTSAQSSMCGYFFEIGNEYVVYANGIADDLSVENCSRTGANPSKAEARYLAGLKKKYVPKN